MNLSSLSKKNISGVCLDVQPCTSSAPRGDTHVVDVLLSWIANVEKRIGDLFDYIPQKQHLSFKVKKKKEEAKLTIWFHSFLK